MNFLGINIIEHPLATMTFPNRQHKRRKWMGDTYHRRIQKKWRKRFGTHQEPCAIFMSPGALGLPGEDRLIIHPERIAILRNFATIDSGTARK